MSKPPTPTSEPRRGTLPAEEAYLAEIGERVRVIRARRGMSRKVLSGASGVSERYLADLERGAGNASLLVLRQIATAMGVPITDLIREGPERPHDLTLVLRQLERLPADKLAEARRLLMERFGTGTDASKGRIALIGLRGAGKTTLGEGLASHLGIPFIELDREIERASGTDLAEIFAVHGQAVFRRLEMQCLERVIAENERAVIAVGGSLVTEPVTFDLLLASCFVVWLKAAPEQHMARVAAQGDLRPMAGHRQAMDDLKAILESRAALYARADAELDTSKQEPETALKSLAALLARHRRA